MAEPKPKNSSKRRSLARRGAFLRAYDFFATAAVKTKQKILYSYYFGASIVTTAAFMERPAVFFPTILVVFLSAGILGLRIRCPKCRYLASLLEKKAT